MIASRCGFKGKRRTAEFGRHSSDIGRADGEQPPFEFVEIPLTSAYMQTVLFGLPSRELYVDAGRRECAMTGFGQRLWGRRRTHVIVGKKDHGGKPFVEYDAPDGGKVRVWSPSVVQGAYRRADVEIDKAMAAIREDERRFAP